MTSNFSPPQNIGFIGLGNMGAPMAQRLAQAGYQMVIADASREAVDSFAEKHDCEVPVDNASLSQHCRVIITMLPDGKVVREVLLGEQGVVSTSGDDLVIIDMSSSSAVGTRELAADLEEFNTSLIDAPVSGGVKKAVDGSLAIMAGGDKDTVSYYQPMLEIMGRVFHTGETGSGHAMKSLNNYLSAVSLASAAEAVMAGKAFGLDPETMVEILNVSSGRSNSTQTKYPDFILNQAFNSGFAIGLLAKDLRLACEIAQVTETPSELMHVCTDLWQKANQDLGPGADHTEVVKYLESLDKD